MEQARGKQLPRLLKSFFSVVLCCALVFAYSYRKPVKAEAALTTVATVAGVVAVAAAASALGIGIGASMSGESYQQACQNIWDGVSDGIKNQLVLTDLAVHDGLAQLTLTQDFLRSVYDGLKANFAQSPGDSYISGAPTLSQFASVVHLPADIASTVYGIYSFSHATSLAFVSSWNFPNYDTSASSLTLTLPYVGCTLYCSSPRTDVWQLNDSGEQWEFASNSYFAGNVFKYFSAHGSTWSVYFSFNSSNKAYLYFTNVATGVTLVCNTLSSDVPMPGYEGQDYFNPTLDQLFADGYSAVNNKLDDILDRLRNRVGDQAGNIPVTVPADGDIADQRTRTQSDTLGKDIADDADRTADDDYNNTHDKDTTLPKSSSAPKMLLPTGIQKKFPFCLPWDLAACYKLFQVAPKAPVWSIPIDIDQGALHLHKTYTYDLNGNNVMDTCLPVFKWFVNIGFIIMLIVLTRKIMS